MGLGAIGNFRGFRGLGVLGLRGFRGLGVLGLRGFRVRALGV